MTEHPLTTEELVVEQVEEPAVIDSHSTQKSVTVRVEHSEEELRDVDDFSSSGLSSPFPPLLPPFTGQNGGVQPGLSSPDTPPPEPLAGGRLEEEHHGQMHNDKPPPPPPPPLIAGGQNGTAQPPPELPPPEPPFPPFGELDCVGPLPPEI